jgi:tRNA(Ile)-lysidine synthetase-like protein
MLLELNLLYRDFVISDFSPAANHFLIACSGGADSVFLLHSVHKLLAEHNLQQNIICAHFNHRWSSSSEKPVQIVKNLCRELNIKFVCGKAKNSGQNSEAEARDERYAFLTQAAISHKANIVLTAHHLDDQIETFFLRLLRGSGTEGLTCMQKARNLAPEIKLLRPLLEVDKAQLIAYCQSNKLFYYEDPSNDQLDIKRNQIRKQIIPLIERLQPSYKNQISNLIEILNQESEFIKDYVNNLNKSNFTNTKSFLKQEIAIQREILKELLISHSILPSYELIERLRKSILKCMTENQGALEKSVLAKKKISLSKEFFFECNKKHFGIFSNAQINNLNKSLQAKFVFDPFKFNLKASDLSPQIINIPQIGLLLISKISSSIDLSDISKERNSYSVYVDLSDLEKSKFEIRQRMPGDIFQPINCGYSVKLKSFLINRKISSLKNRNNFAIQNESEHLINKANSLENTKYKEHIIVMAVENSSNVLWIPGVELSDLIKVKDKATHLLELQYKS